MSVSLTGDRVWCPLCRDFTTLIRIQRAAKLVDMHIRTIYRYVEEGRIHAIKVAGKSYRVCSGCLVNPQAPPEV